MLSPPGEACLGCHARLKAACLLQAGLKRDVIETRSFCQVYQVFGCGNPCITGWTRLNSFDVLVPKHDPGITDETQLKLKIALVPKG